MAIAFVSQAVGSTGPGFGPSVTINVPASIVAGNLLVAIMFQRSLAGFDAPSGWASAPGGANLNAEPPGSMNVFTRVATSSEPASYTFNPTGGGSIRMCGAIVQFSGAGVDGSCAFTPVAASTTSASTPSVTPGAGNTADYWVTGYGASLGPNVATPPGATLASVAGNNNVDTCWVFYTPLASSSPTGTQSATLDRQSPCIGLSMLLGPPAPSVVTGTASVALGPLAVAASNTFSAIGGAATVALGPLAVAVTNAGLPVFIYVGSIPHTNATGQPP